MAARWGKNKLLGEICLELGECYAQLGEVRAAENNFLEALALEPENPQCYIGLARALGQEGQWDKAESYLWKAIELDSGSSEALSAMGGLMLARGNPAAAWDWCQRALEASQRNREALLGLVQAADDLEKLNVTLPYLKKYLEQHLLDFEALYALAEVQHRLGQVEEALEVLGKILLFQPEHAGALALKAEIQKN